MLVKNLVSWSGEHFSHAPGDILDLPDGMAIDRIRAEVAELAPEGADASKPHVFDPDPAPEQAVVRVIRRQRG